MKEEMGMMLKGAKKEVAESQIKNNELKEVREAELHEMERKRLEIEEKKTDIERKRL